MTVSSLWTVLDEAGCGSPVGIDDFDLRGRGNQPEQQTVLAVDLSIWVCEGIASTALSSFHSDPALYLVYQRTIKLLKLGLGLVFVVEGAQRSQTSSSSSSSSQMHELKRRSGSQFWNASKRCESMLQLLGVPVVRAEAEGEALCALLNSTGLVDGVISNDGDCLLFGAKTIYTNFSSENIENRQVMRYDSEKLVANLDGNGISSRTIKLSREDLVAFSMLCGSDMCGSGVPHCGHRKAIQFMNACRSLKHRCSDRTCLDELLSWADNAEESSTKSTDMCLDCDDDGPSTISTRCCSLCLHPGNKLQHEKHGCEECGTGPGEGCYVVTSSEKFLRSLKQKAIGGSIIAPRHIVNIYFSPNDNNVPSSLNSLKSKPFAVSSDASKLFSTSMILKGRSQETSHDYIKQTLTKLLARFDLWSTGPRNRYASTKQKYKPIPVRIEKSIVKQSWPCYEIIWSISINPLEEDGQQFSTCESQSLVNSNFPQLIKAYQQEERRKQQGRAEDERRKRFIGTNHAPKRNQNQRRDFSKKPQAAGNRRKRERNFEHKSKVQKTSSAAQGPSTGLGNDVSMLMDYLPNESFEESDVEECSQTLTHDTQGDVTKRDVIDLASHSDDTEKPKGIANGNTDHYGCIHGLETSKEIDEGKESSQYCSLDDHLDDILGERAWDEIAKSNDIYHDDCFGPSALNQHDTQDYTLDYGDLRYPLPDNVARQSCEDVETMYQEPFPEVDCLDGYDDEISDLKEDVKRQTWDINGAGYDDNYLGSSDQNARGVSSTSNNLSPSERVFCQMGSISIEVTPMISRRWRFF